MSDVSLTREEIVKLCKDVEKQYQEPLWQDVSFLLDFGRSMGQPNTFVDVLPGLQGLVDRVNTSHVRLFYPRMKRWLDPSWRQSVWVSDPQTGRWEKID